jgi:hypothetical protein
MSSQRIIGLLPMPGTLIIKAPAAAKIAIAKITKVSNTNLGFIKAWLKSLRIPINEIPRDILKKEARNQMKKRLPGDASLFTGFTSLESCFMKSSVFIFHL